VVKEVSDPRLPTLRGKLKAKTAAIPVWDKDQLGVDLNKIGLKGSPTRVVKIFRPKVAREGEKVNANDEDKILDAVNRLEAFLKTKELI
jgi:electron transfer flavoprotein beta subunit